MDSLKTFTPATRSWFDASFQAPTPAQSLGWPAIASGENTLIHAPTGSGKTLAAFLWTLDRLLSEPVPERDERCRVLYISPLKALAHDVDRNLRAPLTGIRHAAQRLGVGPLPELTTFLRTGDTPQEDRRKMQRNPPDILITTPESLYLMLTSAVRSTLRSVRWVIVDEVHAVAGSKRGAHLSLSLERLEEITDVSPQRIGLSATQRPLETIAQFLGGGTIDDGTWTPRPVEIIDVPSDRELDIELVVPVEDMSTPAPDPLDPDAAPTRSIWPAVYPALLDQIRDHQSTIVFANSRRLAERVCSELNRLAGEEIARAHHGSVAREQRLEIEEGLKSGSLKAVVATSSLELGIDMGAVDLVLQIESPGSVASGLQRVGRSRHQVGRTSKARIYPKYRGDLLVATVVASEMVLGNVEPTRIPENPLDVLSQHIVAAIVIDDIDVDSLFELVRRATPYRGLTRAVFESTLDMLAGRYPSDLFSELRPRINWDRVGGMLSARPGARQLAVTNAGTIPDRGLFRVSLPDGSRVGELDEEMVYESRAGDSFLLGSTAWRITEIDHDRVTVVPAPPDGSHKMPFWHGDMLGRPIETGRAVGRFIREIGQMDSDTAHETLRTQYKLDDFAAGNLVQYLAEELEATGHLPGDEKIVVERFQDEIGDWRVVMLSPFGARIHAPWAMALRHKLRARYGSDVDMIWSDDGIAIRFPDSDEVPGADELILDPEEVESILIEHLGETALFGARFREAAGRSLLLPRRRPGERTPLWLQRRKASDLLSVANQFGTFPIVLETYREVLRDDFDLPALQEVLGDIRSRKIRLVEVDLHSPSPFATSLLFSFIAAYLYESDTPIAERRAAALTLDRDLLRELLGDGELRELIDPEVVGAIELELQYMTEQRTARHADAVHDMLRNLGPMTRDDVLIRSGESGSEDLEALIEQRRVFEVTIGGQDRLAAVEDMARLRDGVGVQPPPGVPHVFLEPVPDPLGDIVGRYARTHTPFSPESAAASLGLPVAVVTSVLSSLEGEGRVIRGAFLRGGRTQEWVDNNVLKRLKRRSLANLREEIEPVEPHRLARFVIDWHRISDERRGVESAGEAISQLQGSSIPASILERDVLVSRSPEASPYLDRMLISGDLVWVGREPLGTRDGKVSLFKRDSLSTLWEGPEPDVEPDPTAAAILEHLTARGASFFRDIYSSIGGGDIDGASSALWDLVWAGLVTNDSFEPVRQFLASRRRRAGRGRPTPAFPSYTSGRWSLVESLISTAPSVTEIQAARASLMLDRHGVVTRSTVLAEGYPGGFTALYPVLAHLEETGRLRRGYFVEGLGGSQFALPGAVDRLRSEPEPRLVALAAADPANIYGSTLPWPESPARLARDAGAYVLLHGGRLIGYLDRSRKNLTILPPGDDLYGEIGRELAVIAARHRRTVLETVGDDDAPSSPLAPVLREWGFAPAPRGLAYRR
ncbi:MAG TPA: DEAD/DEAH box helicase [Acidimicrobiia bacterium]|nr:DEAD/DEAH box helicase [Acidimicrobiia bacterium]